MRRAWIIGAVAGALAVAAVGGVALAQTATSTPTPSATATASPTATATPDTFTSRLAQALGIPESQLTAAIQKVQRQQQDDAVTAFLAKAVKAGKLTQAQSDAYLAWWKSRPDTFPLPFGFGGGPVRHFVMPPGGKMAPSANGSSAPAAPTSKFVLPPFGQGGSFGGGEGGFGGRFSGRGFGGGGQPGAGLTPPSWVVPQNPSQTAPPASGTSA